jgi:DNA modification methylase
VPILKGTSVSESFLNGKVELHCGDLLTVLPMLAENSIDACVTDPPYHLTSIVKRFARTSEEKEHFARDNHHTGYRRLSTGFMGKAWDGGDIAFRVEMWAEVYRVMKPGAHLLAFSGTRTYHRMVCAIEDAGFEIRDTIMWVYGSGFPKSHDVSKGIDRAAGAARGKVRTAMGPTGNKYCKGLGDGRPWMEQAAVNGFHEHDSDEPATEAARQWEGWGTALKPACEPIVVARKPLSEGTVAANVLRWGTGAINVDGCRVEASDERSGGFGNGKRPWETGPVGNNTTTIGSEIGRWPANLIHDGSEEVLAGFPETIAATSRTKREFKGWQNVGELRPDPVYEDDGGSAARFFYTAKADSDDRLGSKHPTVKPLDLMQYLVRLVTPPKGLVLDPFAGTGTTGEAAFREGFRAVLIEREAEYQADIRRRMKLAMSGPDERARESIKEKMKGKPVDAGPLFAEPTANSQQPTAKYANGRSKSKFFVALDPIVPSARSD